MLPKYLQVRMMKIKKSRWQSSEASKFIKISSGRHNSSCNSFLFANSLKRRETPRDVMFGASSLKITLSVRIRVWSSFVHLLTTHCLGVLGGPNTGHLTLGTQGILAVYWSHIHYIPCRATQRLNSGTE